MCRNLPFVTLCLFVSLTIPRAAQAKEGSDGVFPIGAAEVDVTPDYPIRLSGYAARSKESQGVEQHIRARALAIGSDDKGAPSALLVTVDNVGVSDAITRELAGRLRAKIGLAREKLVLCATHTHTAPMLAGVLPNLFGAPLPPEQQATVDRYTRELLDKLEKVSLDAVAARRPAHLSWGQGEAGFAANRRTKGGPVDHAVPVLCARGLDGKVTALVVNYACHCTSIAPAVNTICGDWAGYACEDIERDYPGAVVLATIGCGADANPDPRGTVALAQQHGRELADAVGRVLKAERKAGAGLKPVTGALQTHFEEIAIPFDKPPTREQWEELAKRTDAAGGNARLQLDRLGRGGAAPRELPYQVAAWTFGDDLAMVFLAGEVVVDYDLRLKRDFDAGRLWVTAYANSVPCYIPSRRVLNEGGYEAEGAMVYYGQPGRLAPVVEDQIVEAVHDLLPTRFCSAQSLNEFPLPLSPREALAAFRTRNDLVVELVASEPLVVDPVYIDWGPDGKLWVVEMNDYPTGLAENHTPGGRIRVLESTFGDGRYDKATTFATGLRMPTGVTPWGDGALVCAAPDILYLHDTHGTGRADAREVLFSGFGPDNEQWLVNGLTPGLDGWLYGASSIANGPIRVSGVGGADNEAKVVELGQRDFRLKPDARLFEPASGRTQYVRVRDDWGDWFGNDNSNLLFHYPLPEHYLRRNPAAAAPASRVLVPAGYDVNQLYPASRILPRFNDPGSAGRTTSACGPTIYRDDLLGQAFVGNAFACEPVHNLVTRLVLEPKGATFTGRRSDDNAHSEFLASTDNWFRPVQVRTGPDGALWVVDMYRFVIEHPRWISPDRLAAVDVRAGADRGRIYRVYPKNAKPRPVPDLTKLSPAELAARLDGPNGPLRDLVQRELVRRGGKDAKEAVATLEGVARQGTYPAARAQAMWTLEGMGAQSADVIVAGLGDADARVRRQALRLSEPHLNDSPAVAAAVLRLSEDADAQVRYQLALSLGAWDDPRAAETLGRLAVAGIDDPWVRAAVVTSAGKRPSEVLAILLKSAPDGPGRGAMVAQLIATAGAGADAGGFARLLSTLTPAEGEPVAAWQVAALAAAMDAMQRRDVTLASLEKSEQSGARDAAARARRVIEAARQDLREPPPGGDDAARVAAAGLIGRVARANEDDVRLLASLLKPQFSVAVQQAALAALGKTGAAPVAGALLERWPKSPPAMREAILQTLLVRKEWTAALLDVLADGKVKPTEIGAASRARLLALADPALRDRARSLLSAAAPSARKQVLETYKPALSLKGDPAKGAATFAKTCTACHQLAGQGHAVGPDLTALTDRSPQALSVAILDPNAAVDGKYVNYVVDLRDGRTLSGIIADETANALTVLQPNGQRDVVSRGDIASLRSTGLSLMPEGLEAGLSPQDLADLMAYVAAARPAGSR